MGDAPGRNEADRITADRDDLQADAKAPAGSLQDRDEPWKKPRLSYENRGFRVGRRDWTRTNDPHHVKVVL